MSDITLTRPEVELLRRYGFAVTSQSKKDIYEVNLGLQSYDPEDVRNILNQLSGNDTKTKGPRGPGSTAPKATLTPESPKESKQERILREIREQDAKRITELEKQLLHEPEDTRYPLCIELKILEYLRDLPNDEYLHGKNTEIQRWLYPIQKFDQGHKKLEQHDLIKQLTQVATNRQEIFRKILSTDQHDSDIENLLQEKDSLNAIDIVMHMPKGQAVPECKTWEKRIENFNGCDGMDVMRDMVTYYYVPKLMRSILQLSDNNTMRTLQKRVEEFLQALNVLLRTEWSAKWGKTHSLSPTILRDLSNIIDQCYNTSRMRTSFRGDLKKQGLVFISNLLKELSDNAQLKAFLSSEEYIWKLNLIREFISQKIDKSSKV